MVNIVKNNHCNHCGASFPSGCVIKFICRVCESSGHIDGTFGGKCPVCYPPKDDPNNDDALPRIKQPIFKKAA